MKDDANARLIYDLRCVLGQALKRIAELESALAEARKAGAVEVLTAFLDSAVECGMTFIQLSAVRAVRDRCKRGDVNV